MNCGFKFFFHHPDQLFAVVLLFFCSHPLISFTQQCLTLKCMNLPRSGPRGNYICQRMRHVLVLLSQQGAVTQPDASVCMCVSLGVCPCLNSANWHSGVFRLHLSQSVLCRHFIRLPVDFKSIPSAGVARNIIRTPKENFPKGYFTFPSHSPI